MKNQQIKTGSSSIAWMLLLLFSWSLFQPALTFAGGGGPTQPEATAFTPIGVSDMVDPFTGDFTYNIPLMDIEGYPINIAYNSGVTMDQEASWVGLGWNLNAGAIVRSLRGLPDDFNGDEVVKTNNVKPNVNINVDGGLSGEIFGFKTKVNENNDTVSLATGLTLKFNASLGYNNYSGFNSSISAGLSSKLGKALGGSLNGGFSLSGSSENGASFSPNLSLSYKEKVSESKDINRSGTIGTPFNSRAGLQSLSYGFSVSNSLFQTKKNEANEDVRSKYDKGTSSGINGSFDIGLAQYMPTPSHPKVGMSLAFSFNQSATVFGGDGQWNIGISYSSQWIPDDKKEMKVPSYGYLYHNAGITKKSNQLDFNRDNDQAFSKYSVNLPSTFQTYDIFSVQAQGTSGSFRSQRNEVSYVFDAESRSYDLGASVGLELGFGNLSDLGVDIQIPFTNSYQGIWEHYNNANDVLQPSVSNPIVPGFMFVEASESSVQSDKLMTQQFYATNPEKLVLEGTAFFPRLTNKLNQDGNIVTITRNHKNSRELTNNQLYMLTKQEVDEEMGVVPVTYSYSGAKSHHIAEITQLGQDGRRYVFGLPAYNHFQEDVTFATGNGMYSNDGIVYAENNSGIISYTANDPTKDNKRGIDNYYNSVKTPPYAHSFMLSAVLSDDFVDIDQNGPSENDLGSYVKFDYSRVENHQWRSPMNANEAFYNEGMRTDKTDDKASFTHGEKDLFYLQYVETKNYLAVFVTEVRKDGYSAAGRDGGFNSPTNTNTNSRCLKSITLYSKADVAAHGNDYNQATPIQKVEFEYNYTLCKNYPANRDNTTAGGKLTLTDIKFTYQDSKKMQGRGYHFTYSTTNPDYNLKSSDRWGTYKPNVTGSDTLISTPLNNAEYPYSEQNKSLADQNASAWALTTIKLPSGGEINVSYESDDYQFVQHKRASQMFKLIGAGFPDGSDTIREIQTIRSSSLHYQDLVKTNPDEKNPYLLFELENQTDPISKYVQNGQQLYFRALMELNPNGPANNVKQQTEFVSGYGIVKHAFKDKINGVYYGAIQLKGEKISDIGPSDYSPLIKQALLFGRSQLSRYITQNVSSTNYDSNAGVQGLKDFGVSILSSLTSFKELATGPNKFVLDQDKAKRFVPLSSWIRLLSPSGRKLGGGSRVKQIRISDKWDAMNGGAGKTYGQSFKYELEDGTSSGVASYEPQLGGDENTWHSAYIINQKKRLAMDDKMYIEDPIMESQFPSPSVGYSRVVITDLNSENIGVHGTGKVVKEFYTAKDFPTIVKSTEIDILPKNSFLPLLPKYQYLTANQGFSIELNDMHGKPKKESVYAQGQVTPLSTVEYLYKSEELGLGGVANKRLKNEVTVIDQNGTNRTETIGVRYDVVADFRESKTVSQVPQLHIGTNSFLLSILFATVPSVYPSYDRTTNRFRSATLNKTVQRFGILEKTVANQDGSIVETNNLAYDAQTGQVLVTQTTTDFNDKVYSLNYPAYWKYESFGQASKNILYSYKATTINNNGFAAIPSNLNYFTEGDEVSVTTTSGVEKAWVIEKNANGIRLEKMTGAPVSGTNATIKVIRSGYRNKQQTSMASMTTLDNPIDNLPTNQFSQVLNAGAVEFSQDWKTYCDCFTPSSNNISNNPYVLGIKGSWRPIKSYTYLSGRTQTNYDGNSNIRKDGVFTSYAPFYKLGNGKWVKDGFNWTFVSEVTQFSPNGMTLETKDALGRYSSSLFSFNNTLTTAVAANAKMTQIASGSFEDLAAITCADQGYFTKSFNGTTQVTIPSTSVTTSTAHTGKTSIVVTPAAPVTFQNTISTCTVPNTCTLALACGANCTTVNISGGTAPYTMETTPQGVATAELTSANQISVTMTTSDPTCKQVIYVTDAKGCKAGIVLTISGGTIQSQIIQF